MISVIVPIYNVDAYLPKCLDSILAQTYREIEIILVDDGSTDGCGRICDEYQARDERITVFHTENKGLSAARNLGIDNAHGDWIMFIDSDDWVDPEFCANPLEKAEQYNADLVAFQSRDRKHGRIVKPSLQERVKKHFQKDEEKRPVGVVSWKTAVQFGGGVAWNKIYRRELFDTIRYPEGRVFEDIAATHQLIFAAKRIVLIPDILYNHVYRANSISHTGTEGNKRDGFLAVQEKYDFLKKHDYPFENFQAGFWSGAMGLLVASSSDDELVRQAEDVVNSIPGYPKAWPLKKRIMLLVWRIDKRLFHLICRICGRKKT